MSYIQNFNYSITGNKSGEKLVFLHGVMGFANNWRKIVQAFEATHEVLVYDQRGHGKSFKPDQGYAPEDYAEDLRLILMELGWDRVNLVGHSMGGRNALHFAWRHPHKVQRLVIEDIGPEASQAAADSLIDLIEMVPTLFMSKLEAKEFFSHRFLELAKNRQNPQAIGQYLYANIEETANGQADWRFSRPAIIESIIQGRAQSRWPEFESLKMPVLLIRGELSRELPRDIFNECLRRNSKVHGLEIAGAGHWVHYDKAQEFIEALKGFLAES